MAENTPNKEHLEIVRLLRDNNDLLQENNVLLRKLRKHNMYGVIFRLVWFGMLIGLPFAVYFYFLEPYFEMFGSNYDVFRQGVAEIPGLKGIDKVLPGFGN